MGLYITVLAILATWIFTVVDIVMTIMTYRFIENNNDFFFWLRIPVTHIHAIIMCMP